MTFQPKARYLPDDVKAYKAPRPRTDVAMALLAACLALVAYVEPQPRAFEAEAGQAVAAVLTTAELPVCPSRRDGQWLRYGVLHCPDSAPLWACERSCLYGHPQSARFVQ